MSQYKRSDRLGEIMREEISDILYRHIKDPRINGLCSIVRVDVSDDLRYAKVSVSVMGDENQQKSTLAGLKSAANYIRREISRRIDLRYIPEMTFVLDKSIEYSIHIDQIIKEFKKENQNIDQ